MATRQFSRNGGVVLRSFQNSGTSRSVTLPSTDTWPGDGLIAFLTGNPGATFTQTAGPTLSLRANVSNGNGRFVLFLGYCSTAEVAGGGYSVDAGAVITVTSSTSHAWGLTIILVANSHLVLGTWEHLPPVTAGSGTGQTSLALSGDTAARDDLTWISAFAYAMDSGTSTTQTMPVTVSKSGGGNISALDRWDSSAAVGTRNRGLGVYVANNAPAVSSPVDTITCQLGGASLASVYGISVLLAPKDAALGDYYPSQPYLASGSPYHTCHIWLPTALQAGQSGYHACLRQHGGGTTSANAKNINPAVANPDFRVLSKGHALISATRRPVQGNDGWIPGGMDVRYLTRALRGGYFAGYGITGARVVEAGRSAGAGGVLGKVLDPDDPNLRDLAQGYSGYSDRVDAVLAWYPFSHPAASDLEHISLGIPPTGICDIDSQFAQALGSPNTPVFPCALDRWDAAADADAPGSPFPLSGSPAASDDPTKPYNQLAGLYWAQKGTAAKSCPPIRISHGINDDNLSYRQSDNDQIGSGAGLPEGIVQALQRRGVAVTFTPNSGVHGGPTWVDDASNPDRAAIQADWDWLALVQTLQPVSADAAAAIAGGALVPGTVTLTPAAASCSASIGGGSLLGGATSRTFAPASATATVPAGILGGSLVLLTPEPAVCTAAIAGGAIVPSLAISPIPAAAAATVPGGVLVAGSSTFSPTAASCTASAPGGVLVVDEAAQAIALEAVGDVPLEGSRFRFNQPGG